LPFPVLAIGAVVCAAAIWLIPSIPVGILGALLIVVFGFFFATVSSRMVGLVGSSNNPVSGMAIATLLISTAILKATGATGYAGMASAICIGTVICIIAAMAGDTSQDLKTGYIVGATPLYQQIGELLGAVIAAFAIGGVMYLLNNAWEFGTQKLPAPQASLMKLVVEGVMGGTLPWGLIICGVGIAVVIEILRLPVLPVAIGLYLPIYLSAPIFIGGLLRHFFEKGKKFENGKDRKETIDRGVLYSSGMIAGEGLVGVFIAVLAAIPSGKDGSVLDRLNLNGVFGNTGGVIFFLLLLASMYFFSLKRKKA
ncbi:MAG: OPT/YSL family transporter, partial [Lachnospiraceae bacterium]|nr:OPT/YSL family transporter [Lachnospiraceae bacterium]